MNKEEQKTTEMTQTAVEWLVEQMLNQMELRIENTQTGIGLFEQAKEMFKQQMIEFGYACTKQIEMNEAGELQMVKSPEQLYTQVYGGKMNMTTNNNPGNNKHGL
jgi:exonuclease VII large subunit